MKEQRLVAQFLAAGGQPVAVERPGTVGQEIVGAVVAHHGAALTRSRLRPLIRAVQVFGFHLATVDLRQSSDKHEEVVAELLRTARIEADYSALDEAGRRELLMRVLNDARSLRVIGAEYSDHARSELAIFETARESLKRFGISLSLNDPRWGRRPCCCTTSSTITSCTRGTSS